MLGPRSLLCVSLCVLALWLSGCRSCCPKGSDPSDLMETEANGLAYFVDADPGPGTRHVAKLQIDGGWEFTEVFSMLDGVVAAHVFAAPGSPTTEELAACENLVYTLPNPPAHWSSPWVEGRWDASTVRYRVLVRLVFRSEGELLHHDRTIDAAPLAVSTVTKAVPQPMPSVAPGNNTAASACTGTFNNAQNLALYDLDIIYDAAVDRIEVYAKPAGDPTPLPDAAYLVHVEEDPPARGWHPTSLAGSYDGSNDYAMLIRVYFASGTPAYADLRGTYTGIVDGAPILLQ